MELVTGIEPVTPSLRVVSGSGHGGTSLHQDVVHQRPGGSRRPTPFLLGSPQPRLVPHTDPHTAGRTLTFPKKRQPAPGIPSEFPPRAVPSAIIETRNP